MDLIVDLIDQLIEARIKHAFRDPGGWDGPTDEKVARLKERLRRVLAENIPNK